MAKRPSRKNIGTYSENKNMYLSTIVHIHTRSTYRSAYSPTYRTYSIITYLIIRVPLPASIGILSALVANPMPNVMESSTPINSATSFSTWVCISIVPTKWIQLRVNWGELLQEYCIRHSSTKIGQCDVQQPQLEEPYQAWKYENLTGLRQRGKTVA